MWNKRSLLLLARVKVRGDGRRVGLALPIALFAPQQWLLAWDGLLALIPGAAGQKVRRAADTLQAIVLQLMYAEPQTIVDVDIRDGREQVRVLVRSMGWKGGADW